MRYNVGDVIEVTNTKGRPLDFVRNDMNHYPVGSILEVIDIKKSTDNPKVNMDVVRMTRHVEARRGNN